MKKFFVWPIAFLLCFASVAGAQQREYVYTCGKKNGTVTTSVAPLGNGELKVGIDINGEKSELLCNGDYSCKSCEIADKRTGNELYYVLENGVYRIRGNVKGKAVDKTVESSGNPWFQNLSVAIGRLSKKGESFRFETFQPFGTDPVVMEAQTVSREKIGERDVLLVRVSPVGALSKFWHGDYYVDEKDLSLVKYTSVEGVPTVTPRTTWILK